MLTEQGIRRYIKSPIDVIFFEESPSTNLEAKRIAEAAGEGTAIFARRQLSGRGRMGRGFESPEGGIYMTMLARPADTVCLSMAAAAAVRRAMVKKLGLDPEIKWVNDIYWGGKKVCGILAEGAFCNNELRYAAVGVGLNYQSPEFTGGLSEKAGSLYPRSDPPVSIDEMAAAMADELYVALTNPSDPSIYREYRANSMLTGKRVVIMREGEPEATAMDVTPKGHLLVRFDDGRTEELYSGEVSVRAAESPHTV